MTRPRPLLLALVLAVLVAGCARTDRAALRQPLPLPTEMAHLDQPIQAQIRARHDTLSALLARPEATDDRLAAAFGALGQALHAHGFLPLAADAYRRATRLAPERFDWFYYLGRVEQVRGDWARADAALERALALRPADVPALVARAQGWLAHGRPADAEALFERALAADPSCAAALAGLGQIALDGRDPRAAVRAFEAAAALQPHATPIQYQLARAYQAMGDTEKAQAHFARVPANNFMHTPVNLADPLMAEMQSLLIGARSHDFRGLRALNEGRYDLAAIEFRQALAIDPDRVYAHYGLALALHHLGRLEEAAESLEILLETAPDDAPSLLLLAQVDLERGNRARAESLLRRAVAAGEPSGEAARLLANL